MTALSEASKQAAMVAIYQTSIGSVFATEYIRISNAATALMRDFTKVTVFAGENSEPARIDQESVAMFLKMRSEISDSKPLGHFPETSLLTNPVSGR